MACTECLQVEQCLRYIAEKHVGRPTSTVAISRGMRADLPGFNPGSAAYNFCELRQAA